MLEIKVSVDAPELTSAINNLAASLGKGMAVNVNTIAAPVKTENQPVEAVAAPQQTSVPVEEPTAPATQPSPVQEAPKDPTPAAPVSTPTPQAPVITLDMISRAGAALVDQGKMPQIMGLLTKYGVQAITQLNVNTYEAFATDLRALGASI